MKIAFFDLGQHMAVAHNIYGPKSVRVDHRDATGDRIERAAETLGWLSEFFRQAAEAGGLDAVCYERPFARGQAATRALWGLAGLIEACAGAWNLPCIDYAPSEIKKHATGDGKADKDAMILAAACTGYIGDDEHEADCWCGLRFAEDNLKPSKKGKK